MTVLLYFLNLEILGEDIFWLYLNLEKPRFVQLNLTKSSIISPCVIFFGALKLNCYVPFAGGFPINTTLSI